MGRGGTFAAIDVGSTKICTVVGDATPDGEFRVLGVGISPAFGLGKGVVENIQEATESIRSSVDKAERSSGTHISSAYVGISGAHISSMNNRGIVAVASRQHPISHDDVARAVDAARTVSIPTNREVLHVIPRFYVVDGQEVVRDPTGMYGQRLDVEAHIITGTVTAMQNLMQCVEGAGVAVDALVLEPLAAADAILEHEERMQGVILADIGGGTTDLAVYVDGTIYHTAVLPVGGYHLTHDLVVGLRAPFKAAEEAKHRHGHALPSAVDPHETVEIDAFGSDRRREVPRRRIAEILQARVEEILEMIYMEVKRAGYDEMISAGLVLTGGTANLRGIDKLAEEVLQMPVRVGTPRHMHGLVETISNPAYATSVGLLRWAIREQQGSFRTLRPRPGIALAGWLERFRNLARVLLPE